MTPSWILDILAALMLAVAAVSASRLAARQPWQHGSAVTDTDIAHLLMAIAMAGMLAPDLTTMPDTAWEAIFAVMTAWFACRAIRDARASGARALAGGHYAPHLIHSAAMLYMFLALVPPASAGHAMGGMGAAGLQSLDMPTLGLVFALVLTGYTIWDLDQISGRFRGSVAGAGTGRPAAALAVVPAALSPGMTVACRIAMGATMAFMLLIMI